MVIASRKHHIRRCRINNDKNWKRPWSRNNNWRHNLHLELHRHLHQTQLSRLSVCHRRRKICETIGANTIGIIKRLVASLKWFFVNFSNLNEWKMPRLNLIIDSSVIWKETNIEGIENLNKGINKLNDHIDIISPVFGIWIYLNYHLIQNMSNI